LSIIEEDEKDPMKTIDEANKLTTHKKKPNENLIIRVVYKD